MITSACTKVSIATDWNNRSIVLIGLYPNVYCVQVLNIAYEINPHNCLKIWNCNYSILYRLSLQSMQYLLIRVHLTISTYLTTIGLPVAYWSVNNYSWRKFQVLICVNSTQTSLSFKVYCGNLVYHLTVLGSLTAQSLPCLLTQAIFAKSHSTPST